MMFVKDKMISRKQTRTACELTMLRIGVVKTNVRVEKGFVKTGYQKDRSVGTPMLVFADRVMGPYTRKMEKEGRTGCRARSM